MFETSQNIMELYATSIKILTCISRHKYEYKGLCDHWLYWFGSTDHILNLYNK
jgi:hypothetical protein